MVSIGRTVRAYAAFRLGSSGAGVSEIEVTGVVLGQSNYADQPTIDGMPEGPAQAVASPPMPAISGKAPVARPG